MALRRLSYYKKFLHLDMAILLKTNIAYSGLILGIRERDLVFQVNQKILYRTQGQYNVLYQKINVLEIIYINPNNVLVYRLGGEPPVAYLPIRRNNLYRDQLQGSNAILQSSNFPYFALPAENLEQELPNLNAELHGNNENSGVETVDNTDGIVQETSNGTDEDVNAVDQERNLEQPKISEIEEKIDKNPATLTDEFQNSSDPEYYDSSCQSVLEPPSSSNSTSLNTSRNNRFGKNPLVDKYESYCKSKKL